MYASHGLDKKINLQNMQNMKNHVVSGLTQKPQKNKLDNVFFWAEHAEQKNHAVICFDREPHKAQKRHT